MFGHLRIHAPRFKAYVCGRFAASSAMAVLLPHRSTPELRYLQAKLGCKFSYQQAADILNEFLPDLSCFNHATTRNRVFRQLFLATIDRLLRPTMRKPFDFAS